MENLDKETYNYIKTINVVRGITKIDRDGK